MKRNMFKSTDSQDVVEIIHDDAFELIDTASSRSHKPDVKKEKAKKSTSKKAKATSSK